MKKVIIEEARKIGEMLRQSTEYQSLLTSEDAVQKDDEAREIFNKYQIEQNRIRNNSLAGKKPSDADIEIIKELKSKMDGNTIIGEYENASKQFNSLLGQVNMAIEQALSGMEPHTCTQCGRH